MNSFNRVILFLLAVIFQSAALTSESAATDNCGTSADSDIVIMIDRTGSITPSDLTNEKNAAAVLIDFFATSNPKPRIAIGTFNGTTDGGVGYPGPARIHQHLTTNYGSKSPLSGLYLTLNNIMDSSGRTNLSAAIADASSEFSTMTTRPRYIILISDGIANRPPDDLSCGTCGCATAFNLADQNASSSETTFGTKIFAIHYGTGAGCPSLPANDALNPVRFLRDDIATQTSYYFEGNQNLMGVFNQIAQNIACPATPTPSATPTPIALPTITPTATPTSAPHTPSVDCKGVANGNAALDRCGVCAGDGTSCLGCESVDILQVQFALDQSALKQKKLVGSTANLLLHLSKGKKGIVRTARAAISEANILYTQSWTATWSSPQVLNLCSNTIFCATSDNSAQIDIFKRNSAAFLQLTTKLANLLSHASANYVKKAGSVLKTALRLHSANLANAAKIPVQISVCK